MAEDVHPMARMGILVGLLDSCKESLVWMRKWRSEEVKEVGQGHPVGKNLNPYLLTPKPLLISNRRYLLTKLDKARVTLLCHSITERCKVALAS